MALINLRGVLEGWVLLLGYGLFLGIIFTAIYALIKGSRSVALISFLLAILPFFGFAFGLWRVLFWQFYGVIWFVALVLSVAAMIRAYRPGQQAATANLPVVFLLISLPIGFAMLLFFFLGWHMFNHAPVDPSLEGKITAGMTKAEVEALLGPPSGRGRAGDQWSYSVRGQWNVAFQIFFDKQGTVYHTRESDGSELVLR